MSTLTVYRRKAGCGASNSNGKGEDKPECCWLPQTPDKLVQRRPFTLGTARISGSQDVFENSGEMAGGEEQKRGNSDSDAAGQEAGLGDTNRVAKKLNFLSSEEVLGRGFGGWGESLAAIPLTQVLELSSAAFPEAVRPSEETEALDELRSSTDASTVTTGDGSSGENEKIHHVECPPTDEKNMANKRPNGGTDENNRSRKKSRRKRHRPKILGHAKVKKTAQKMAKAPRQKKEKRKNEEKTTERNDKNVQILAGVMVMNGNLGHGSGINNDLGIDSTVEPTILKNSGALILLSDTNMEKDFNEPKWSTYGKRSCRTSKYRRRPFGVNNVLRYIPKIHKKERTVRSRKFNRLCILSVYNLFRHPKKKRSKLFARRNDMASLTATPVCNQSPNLLPNQKFEGEAARGEGIMEMLPSQNFEGEAAQGEGVTAIVARPLSLKLHDFRRKASPAENEKPLHIAKPKGQQGIFKQHTIVASAQDINTMIREFESLKISDSGSGALVLYESRKKHARPIVEIDSWTLKRWNQLMSIDDGTSDVKDDKESDEKYWKAEREVFQGRINSFRSRMHQILGDRRFKAWKGSVVDSVVGVFLTQNVSDTLSSSAYMSLAAKFPLHPSDGVSILPEKDPCYNSYFVIEPDIDDADHGMENMMSLENMVDSSIPRMDPDLVQNNERKKMDKQVIKRDWDSLRKIYSRYRTMDQVDSADWDAVRNAEHVEVAEAIKARGQHFLIAKRIQEFLNRTVELHGSLDLEWLRYAPPEDVKNYLLEISGLGLKSVECVRLLTLKQMAFPVDINVGRIAVRLGWVPLEPLPGNLQFHLLEEYPLMDSIQKYLWPRLCMLDQQTLYELHYQMITFGKVFCRKKNPNCNACPMRAECRHFASAFASANFCLPGPSGKVVERSVAPIIPIESSSQLGNNSVIFEQKSVYLLQSNIVSECETTGNCEPIVEEPKSPVQEQETSDIEDIEDFGYSDDGEVPTIRLNDKEFYANVYNFLDKYKNDVQGANLSQALVPLSIETASIPEPKLKLIGRLRTEHQVYEIPDGHELLNGLERRACGDHVLYHLAIWTPGETASTYQEPKKRCNSQGSEICNDQECFSCVSIKDHMADTVRATFLIPCRTAMKGRFPLNGTYFQVNELFADHESSYDPVIVPRSLLEGLPKRTRTVYFGASMSAIFGGLPMRAIQANFWRGYVCVRGFDRKTGAPKPLSKRFHCPPTKMEKQRNRKGDNVKI